MYRKFNWATRGASPLPSSTSARRLLLSPSFDISPSSPSYSPGRIDSTRDFELYQKGFSKTQLSTPPSARTTFYYHEHMNEELSIQIPVEEVLIQKKTDFQEVKVLRTKDFGKCLISDNHMQSAESDESIYHESLVHPAMLSHPNPETVFIGGGGELATAREILKHRSVKKLVMVDIDKEAVQICLDMLPEWNEGVIDDPRLEIIYGDADAYLKTCGLKFDVIIMDICDPTESGPGWKLYTKEFYQRIKEDNMNGPHSIFCTQSTGASINLIVECFSVINNTLRSVFENTNPYRCEVSSFGCHWGFHICSDSSEYILDGSTNPVQIDEKIREENRIGVNGERTLRHYDGTCHLHMFNLTKYEKEACEDEARLFTLDNPSFMH